ncbi:MAG: hypothetical protein ACI83I_001250, partial [Bacteroidia bacterium]
LGDLPSTFNWTWTIVLDSEIISVIPYTSVVLTEGTPISDFREDLMSTMRNCHFGNYRSYVVRSKIVIDE